MGHRVPKYLTTKRGKMLYRKPGKPVKAKVRTRMGLSDEFIEQGRTGHMLALREADQTALIKWRGKSARSVHPIADLEMEVNQ